ncbi:MAG: flagellar basal body P-ring formation chaperone FlgA [candidate division Zixibacteria bacterium]|nr:flagellar basal body P-ring formation chaperone FlgA [candidate division Zixibacteria bacterium]
MRRLLMSLLILLTLLLLAVGAGAEETGRALIDKVMLAYNLNPDYYTIEILSNQLKTRLVHPDDLDFKALTMKDPVGSFTIRATVTDDGEEIDRGQVHLCIHKYDSVLVIGDRIKRHQQLTDCTFERTRVEVTSLRTQPVRTPDELIGQRARRNLNKGDVLLVTAMESVPDIEVGNEVTITYDDGLCIISAPGTSLQSASVGESVRVRNEASGKIITARVVDGKSVSVDK